VINLIAYGGCGAAAYLAGSIPFGFLIGRARGIDVRTVGSGNIGATNVFRTVGKPWGLLAFLLDALKGLAGAWLIPLALQGKTGAFHLEAAQVLGGCLAVVGHNWPITMRFKGGKGVATSAGVLLGWSPPAIAVGLAVWIIVLVSTRYVSVASLSAAVLIPVWVWATRGADNVLIPVALTVLGLLVIARHRTNLRRLWMGTENRFEFRHGAKRNRPS